MDKRSDRARRRWLAIAGLVTAIAVGPRFIRYAREATSSPSAAIGAIVGLAASAVIIWLVVRRVRARGRPWRAAITGYVAQRRSAGDVVAEIAFVRAEVLAMLRTRAEAGDATGDVRPESILRMRDRSGTVAVVSSSERELRVSAFPFKGFTDGILLLELTWDEISSIGVSASFEGLRSFDELVVHVRGWRSTVRLMMLAAVPSWTLEPLDPRPIAAKLDGIHAAATMH